MKELEPGWLMRTAHEASISMKADHDRSFFKGWNARELPSDLPYPISWEDGDELYRHMDRRFKSWTGRSIEEHLASRKARHGD